MVGDLDFDDITSELHAYQNKAMRTLGFAYKILDNDAIMESLKKTLPERYHKLLPANEKALKMGERMTMGESCATAA